MNKQVVCFNWKEIFYCIQPIKPNPLILGYWKRIRFQIKNRFRYLVNAINIAWSWFLMHVMTTHKHHMVHLGCKVQSIVNSDLYYTVKLFCQGHRLEWFACYRNCNRMRTKLHTALRCCLTMLHNQPLKQTWHNQSNFDPICTIQLTIAW